MPYHKILVACLATIIALSALPINVSADEHSAPLLIESHCMKSTSPDYVGVENDIWLPMHQERVNNGELNSWALYWVQYGDRSKCDYYVIESYLGPEKLTDANPVTGDLFAKVHPGKDMSKAMARTAASRVMVESSLWFAIDGVAIGPHRYATVNYMQSDDPKTYVEMELEIFKPVHQAMSDAGSLAGWGLYSLIAPNSGTMPHNFATVDFFDRWGPRPMGETMQSVHPDMDLEELGEKIEAARQMTGNYSMMLIAATEPPPAE